MSASARPAPASKTGVALRPDRSLSSGPADTMPETFDPAAHRFGPSRYFEDFVLGEAFYIPSRTVTEAQFLAFQAASGDNHRSTTTASTVVATATRTCWRTDTRC